MLRRLALPRPSTVDELSDGVDGCKSEIRKFAELHLTGQAVECTEAARKAAHGPDLSGKPVPAVCPDRPAGC